MCSKNKPDYLIHLLFALTFFLIILWLYRFINLKSDAYTLMSVVKFLLAVFSAYVGYRIYQISKGHVTPYPLIAVCLSIGLEQLHPDWLGVSLVLRVIAFSFLFSAIYVTAQALKKLKVPELIYSAAAAFLLWAIVTIYVLAFFVKERISGYPSYFFIKLAAKDLDYTYFMLHGMDAVTFVLTCTYPLISLAAIAFIAKRMRQWFREKEYENVKASWLLASTVAFMLVTSIPFTRGVLLESEPVSYFIASYFAGMDSRMAFEKTPDYKPVIFLDRKNILFIIVDTLRADRIGEGGYYRDTLAKTQSFFEDSLKVKRFTTNIPASYSSLKALFTGDYPCFERKTHYTLFEAAKYNGYETAVFDSYSKNWFGKDLLYLNNGIDLYLDNTNPPKDAKWMMDGVMLDDYTTFDSADRWLSERTGDRPYMALVYLQSVHHPYNLDDNNLTGFDPPYRPYYRKSTIGDLKTMMDSKNLEINNRYDNSIRYVDSLTYDFLKKQEHDGNLENTVIVFTSDHGEGLGEHQSTFHGTNIFDEQVRVPIYFKGGGIKSKVVDLGQHVDVFPTLMGLLKASGDKDYQGYNLLNEQRHYEYFCHNLISGISDGRYKYVNDKVTGKEELYDLDEDPDEVEDISGEKPDVVRRLSARLDAFFQNPYHKTLIT